MITVDALVSIPSLGLRYLAGEAGGTRPVTWAHTCDLPDPWRWFDTGDLVMTTGAGLPDDAIGQSEWLRQLIDSKVCALVIAPGPGVPHITPALLEVADRYDFPVLEASFDLHFVTLARTVIESAVETERQRVSTVTRLYDVYWQSLHARGTMEDQISALEGATGWALEVHDRSVEDEILAIGRLAQRQRATRAQTLAEQTEIPIPGAGDVQLVAGPGRNPVNDRPLLQHVGGLISLELEYHAAERDRLRASGQDLLAGLLDETITIAAVGAELRHRGMAGPVAIACWSSDADPLSHETVHRQTFLHKYAPLLMPIGTTLIGLVPRDLELLSAIRDRLGDRCAVGVSTALTANSSVPEPARQAQLAAARAHETGEHLVAYGDLQDHLGFLPRSVDDTRTLARKILGPLVAHDKRNDNDCDLIRSVRVFLRNDRALQKSADELGVHRQTLVYRLRRTQELTGLKPTATEGSAMLWLALSAADRANLSLNEIVD